MQTLFLNYNKHYFGDFFVVLSLNKIHVKGRHGLLIKKLRPIYLMTNTIFFLYKQYFRLFLCILRDMLIGVSFR